MAAISTTAGRPPALSPQAVAKLLTGLYPFEAVNESSVKSFPSYDDRNYYFRGQLDGDDAAPQTEFVLKLGNPAFAPFEVVRGVNAMLMHLRRKNIKCIHPILSRKNEDVFEIPGGELLSYDHDGGRADSSNDLKYIVRVFVFLPGVVFDEVDKRFLTPDLLYEVGGNVGRMNTALQDFKHEALEDRDLENWGLINFMSLRSIQAVMPDQHKKQLADIVFKLFEEHIIPKLADFKKGIIYGDANGLNIVLQRSDTLDQYSLAGFIDFGDCSASFYAFEAGIMLAYIMMENENPIEFVAPMLSGYLDAFPLSRGEVDSLYYIVLARCCQSAMLGEHQYTLEPWNDYLLTTPAKAWKVIELLLATPKEKVDEIWRAEQARMKPRSS